MPKHKTACGFWRFRSSKKGISPLSIQVMQNNVAVIAARVVAKVWEKVVVRKSAPIAIVTAVTVAATVVTAIAVKIFPIYILP